MSETNENELLRQQLRGLEARVARLEAERAPVEAPAETGAHDTARAPIAPIPPAPESPPASAAEVAEALASARQEPVPLPVTPPPLPQALSGESGASGEGDGGSASSARGKNRRPHWHEKKRGVAGKEDLEQFFALTVLGRVGIAAVVLAAAYFGQLGWKHFGPGTRAIFVYAFGGAMIGIGALLRRRTDERYVALLWGGGVAVIYLAGVLAHLRYDVVPSSVAVVSLLLTAALGQFLAHRLQLQILATVALAGAYAAPVIVGTPSPTPTAFFVLLMSLHSWAAWIEHRWQWGQARALAVASTLILVWGWYAENGTGSAVSFFWHVEFVWLLLALPELLRAGLRRAVGRERVWAVFLVGAIAHITTLATTQLAGSAAVITGGVLLLVGGWYVPRHALMGRFLARIPAFLLPMGAIIWLDKRPDWPLARPEEWAMLAALTAVGILQLGVRQWTQVGELGAGIVVALGLVMTLPRDWGGALTLAQAPLLLLVPVVLMNVARPVGCRVFAFLLAVGGCLVGVLNAYEPPFAGQELVALGLVVATAMATFGSWLAGHRRSVALGRAATAVHALLLFAWLIYCAKQRSAAVGESLTALWNVRFLALTALVGLVAFARSILPNSEQQQRFVLGCVILVATYFGGLLEVLDFVHGWSFGPRAAATSIYTLVFACTLLVTGGYKRMVTVRWTALIMFGAVAVKVAVYDLSLAKTPVRVLVTGVLGGVLLLVAWGYARHQRD